MQEMLWMVGSSENNMEIEQVYVLYPTFMSVFTILGSTTTGCNSSFSW